MLPVPSVCKSNPQRLSKSDNFLRYRLQVFHLLHPPPPFNYLSSFFFIKLLEIQTEHQALKERSYETLTILWLWKHLQKASNNIEKFTLKIHILWLCPIKYTSCDSIPLKHTSCDSVPLNMSEKFLIHIHPTCFFDTMILHNGLWKNAQIKIRHVNYYT
jgi:hypothetical protein